MQLAISILLVIAGLIHLPPLVGALGRQQLNRAYAVAIEEPNLEVLMRHRAVLLGTLGFFWIAAAWWPAAQPAALLTGFASVGSFLLLTWTTAGTNSHLGRVAVADVVAMASLVAAGVLYWIH